DSFRPTGFALVEKKARSLHVIAPFSYLRAETSATSLTPRPIRPYSGDKAVGRARLVVFANVLRTGDNSLSSSRDSGSAPSNASGGMAERVGSKAADAAGRSRPSLIHCSPSRLFGV